MASTYFIGKKVANPTLGILAAFLVGVIPAVIAEYGIIYLDLPAAALATLGVALYLYQNKGWALFWLTWPSSPKNPCFWFSRPSIIGNMSSENPNLNH